MSTYIQFGAGDLYVNPNAGNLVTNPTPSKGLTIQDITIDQAGDIKELKGQNQYPDDTAKGDIKSTFKFSMGRKDFSMLNNIFNGDATAAGGTTVVSEESHAIPSTPFQITIAPANTGTFAVDLGVTFAATGIRLTRIPSGTPATGQYTVVVGTGVYTFAAADTTDVVLISYAYSQTTIGTTFQIGNHNLGFGPQFEAFIVDKYQPVSGVFSTVRLYACKISKVTMVNKRADYAMPELEGAYFQNAAGKVIDFFSNV